MHIAYAGVSPDQQSPPWAPGMGGPAAPVGTLAGAPAGGLDFLAALLAQTTMPEAAARAPIRGVGRAPLVGLAQTLASADASCPSLEFARFRDVVRAAPLVTGEVALDPPPAARVDEKRALLAGALAILPAPWTWPAFPAPLPAAPASEASATATPHVEVSAREKLLALIAMAQGATSSVTPPVGPGGSLFAQTNPLIQPTSSAASDLERGQTVAPQPSGRPETQVLPPAEPSAAVPLRPPAATMPLPSSPSFASEAPKTWATPMTLTGSPQALAQMAPPAPAMPASATVAAATIATATPAAATTLSSSGPTLREAFANDFVHASARQGVVLPDLPPGERVILEAAPMRPQPAAVDAGLERAERAPRPSLTYASAPAEAKVATAEESPARGLPPTPAPVSEPQLDADGGVRVDPTAVVSAPGGIAADAADRVLFERTVAWSADLRSQRAPTTSPDAAPVVPALRREAPNVPSSVATVPAMLSRLPGDERPQAGPAFAVPTTQDMPSAAEDPVAFGLATQSAQSVTPVAASAVDAPALSAPADSKRPVKVDPAPLGGERPLRPSSPTMGQAAEIALATSEPRPASVAPAAVGGERSLRASSPTMVQATEVAPATNEPRPANVAPAAVGGEPSSLPSPMDLRPDQAAEAGASAGSRSEALAAVRTDVAVPDAPRRAGEDVRLARTPEPSRWMADPALAPVEPRPAADAIAAAPADSTVVDETTAPGFAATIGGAPRADDAARPDPTRVVRGQALPDGRASYGPIGADRSDRFEPTLAVAAEGSTRREEQPLSDPVSSVHKPTLAAAAASVADHAPVRGASRLAWEAYVSASGEPFAPARTAMPMTTAAFASQTVAAPAVAQRWPAGSQGGNQPPDPSLAASSAMDRQPDPSPAAASAVDRQPDLSPMAAPAHPIAPSSAMRPELTAPWRPASGPTQLAAREEHESSPLRRASGQSVAAGARPETPLQSTVADLTSASAPAVDRASSRPLAPSADGPARREASAQSPVADVVSVPAPREGPSIATAASTDPAFEAEAAEGFQELLDRIQIAVRRGESTWKLQLRPPSLGRLEVHLTAGVKGLEIVMQTETAEAQAFLQANLPELSRGLDQRGVMVERCEVSCGQPGADLPGTPGEGRQQAGAAWQFAQPAAPLPIPTARRNAAPTASNAGSHSRSLVDLQA